MPTMPTSGKPNRWHAARSPEQAKLMYNSQRWRNYREVFLRQHPVCVVCEHIATVVDHIQPAAYRPDLFWKSSNHQPMCAECHNRKRATSDKG
jgi:5-methylcytosine-specific restriction protein A